jgi:predicted ArsR family transcriptional regulator
MTRTLSEIAEALSVPRDAADGLVKYLRAVDLARFRGQRPTPTGRGRGAHVYEVLPGAKVAVAAALEKLERLEG